METKRKAVTPGKRGKNEGVKMVGERSQGLHRSFKKRKHSKSRRCTRGGKRSCVTDPGKTVNFDGVEGITVRA